MGRLGDLLERQPEPLEQRDRGSVFCDGEADDLGQSEAGSAVAHHGVGRFVGEPLASEGGEEGEADVGQLEGLPVEKVGRDHERLDVLVNNAGLGAGADGSKREVSADGHELRFAVNYLAPFLLTHLLRPLLESFAPARIVNVPSGGQQEIDFDDVMLDCGYNGMRAYRQSKLALILFTFDLAERLAAEEAGVTVNALHPATLMDTKMVREWFGYSKSSVEEGVEATRRLVIAPELAGVTGAHFEGLEEARAHEREDRSARFLLPSGHPAFAA